MPSCVYVFVYISYLLKLCALLLMPLVKIFEKSIMITSCPQKVELRQGKTLLTSPLAKGECGQGIALP